MTAPTLEAVFEIAQQLSPEQQAKLVQKLQISMRHRLNREVVPQQGEQPSLLDTFPSLRGLIQSDMSTDDIEVYLSQVGREWEAELDEL